MPKWNNFSKIINMVMIMLSVIYNKSLKYNLRDK